MACVLDSCSCDGDLDSDGDGWTVEQGDCSDVDSTVFPDAPEECDQKDNDCDGIVDEEVDLDGDGYISAACGGDDCNDENSYRYPGHEGDIIDDLEQDCDGDGWHIYDGDCDDRNAFLNLDDLDGDSYSTCTGDCDDANESVNPSVAEVFDLQDNDCDGTMDIDLVICSVTAPVDHPSIQDAIDAVQDGDVVCVEEGMYQENINFMGKAIAVVGLAGRTLTEIFGYTAEPVATFSSGEGLDSVLHGITISYGNAPNGGGVYIEDSSPTISSSAITNSRAEGDGGGLYLVNSSAVFSDVIIANNQTDASGGGIAAYDGGDVAFSDLTLTGNTAASSGGGAVASNCSLSMSNAVVSANHALDQSGGG